MTEWVFPADVEGWLTEAEGYALASAARGLRVLEIGSYQGRSTVCMAQVAARVVSVDWHQGDAGSGAGGTEAAFRANLARYAVANKVAVHVCRSAEFQTADRFDLVFIDGAHDYESVVADLTIAIRHLASGGTIATHDCDYPTVRAAVRDVLGGGWTRTVTDRTAFWREAVLPTERPRVLVGMPRSGEVACFDSVKAMYHASAGGCDVIATSSPRISLLDHCFNILWAEALDARDKLGATHFAMIHSDVAPAPGWLDTLLGELGDADLVSAVIPIKDSRGVTSTALNTGDLWLPKRLTMREVMALPETFTAEDTGYPLLLNTGLWVCDLRKPWVDQVCFDSVKRIVKKPDGTRLAQCIPEDWFFSDALNALGCRLKATRKVALTHYGSREFANDRAWGMWKTDEDYRNAQDAAHEKGGHSRGENQVHEGVSGGGDRVPGEAEQPACGVG